MLEMQSNPYLGESGSWVFLLTHSVLSERKESLESCILPNRTTTLLPGAEKVMNVNLCQFSELIGSQS